MADQDSPVQHGSDAERQQPRETSHAVCGACGAQHPEVAKFCGSCGSPLAVACPRCSHQNPLTGQFCLECGAALTPSALAASPRFASPRGYTPRYLAEKILIGRGALEGEQKQVTVVFCDVVSSTALAERHGPEGFHRLLNEFFELALGEVHRYEGTVNQFLGDGFMALFGAPLAHEDHAQRAVLAALAIERALNARRVEQGQPQRIDLDIRIGLNTGVVVVGAIGDNLRMDYTALGDTTNLAARMQQMAPAGAIWAAEATQRLTAGSADWRALGPMAVKGKHDPVSVYELIGQRAVKSRFEVVAQRGLTRFVGRDPELRQLLEACETVEQGRGRVVSLVGEAGIGKSRLLHEFKQRLVRAGISCFEGPCFAYGEIISYLPFLSILRALLGLGEAAAEPEAKRTIRQRLAQLGLEPDNIAPYLDNLLALTVDEGLLSTLTPAVVRQRTVEALQAVVLAEARRQALVLVLEDMHWIDKASEEVLAALVEAMANAPVLLLLVYRPEYLHAWADTAYHARIALTRLPSASSAELARSIITKPYAARLALEPLLAANSTEMAADLLGVPNVPPELEQLIAAKTDGNPLFVEELTRSLLEAGDLVRQNGDYVLTRPPEMVHVPSTVQGVLLARIDRLNERLKQVLQVASAIGRIFSYPVLARVVEGEYELDQALGQLQDLEFLYPISLAPHREYTFKHVLTQEAVYQTLLRSKREEYHERIGQALECLYPERLEEHYEVLAYHYARGTNKDKAVEYLDLANQKAAKANAMAIAETYCDSAINLLDTMPQTRANEARRVSVLVNQGWVMNSLLKLPKYYDVLRRSEPTAVGLDEPGRLGAFYARMGWCEWSFGDFDRAIQTTSRAAALCRDSGQLEDAAQAYVHMQWSQMCKGDFHRSLATRDEVLDVLEGQFNLRWHLFAHAGAAISYTWLGRWDEAEEEGQKALRLGQEFSDSSVISFAAWVLSQAYTSRGDLARAIEYGELAVQQAPTPGDKAWSQAFLAWARARDGQPGSGTDILAQVVAVLRTTRFIWSEVIALLLGEAYWLAGAYGDATRTLQEVLENAGRCDMKFTLGSAHRLLGEIALTTNPRQENQPLAVPHFERSIALLESIGAENELALTYIDLGRLHQRGERVGQAREYFGRALEILDRLGTYVAPTEVRQALAELPRC